MILAIILSIAILVMVVNIARIVVIVIGMVIVASIVLVTRMYIVIRINNISAILPTINDKHAATITRDLRNHNHSIDSPGPDPCELLVLRVSLNLRRSTTDNADR